MYAWLLRETNKQSSKKKQCNLLEQTSLSLPTVCLCLRQWMKSLCLAARENTPPRAIHFHFFRHHLTTFTFWHLESCSKSLERTLLRERSTDSLQPSQDLSVEKIQEIAEGWFFQNIKKPLSFSTKHSQDCSEAGEHPEKHQRGRKISLARVSGLHRPGQGGGGEEGCKPWQPPHSSCWKRNCDHLSAVWSNSRGVQAEPKAWKFGGPGFWQSALRRGRWFR